MIATVQYFDEVESPELGCYNLISKHYWTNHSNLRFLCCRPSSCSCSSSSSSSCQYIPPRPSAMVTALVSCSAVVAPPWWYAAPRLVPPRSVPIDGLRCSCVCICSCRNSTCHTIVRWTVPARTRLDFSRISSSSSNPEKAIMV